MASTGRAERSTPSSRIEAYVREIRERVVADAMRRLPDRLLLTVGEVAVVFAVSEDTVRRMISDGELFSMRIIGGRRVPREVVLDFIRTRLVSGESIF